MTSLNFRPTKGSVIIELRRKSLETDSGIILKSSDAPDTAVVFAVHPDIDSVLVGENLLVNWKGAKKLDGDFYTIKEEDIIGVFEE